MIVSNILISDDLNNVGLMNSEVKGINPKAHDLKDRQAKSETLEGAQVL
jgi:hypothetical protein